MAFIIDNIIMQARQLGMTYPVIARRSGISLPTVKRIMGGRYKDAQLASIEAIARAVGMSLHSAVDTDADTMRLRQAEKKAEKIARQVQATSALEAQGVDSATLKSIRNKIVHELLTGAKMNLWAD